MLDIFTDLVFTSGDLLIFGLTIYIYILIKFFWTYFLVFSKGF